MQGKVSQQKAWKQSYLIDRKQLESFAKDLPKLFTFSSSITPWNQRISKLLAQGEQSENKIAKQERQICLKLNDIELNINSFRQTLKNYDQTNQFLVKVQTNSQNILAKLEHFRGKMAMSYEQLAQEQCKLNDELSFINKKIETWGEREQPSSQLKENIKTGNRQNKLEWRGRQKFKQLSPQLHQNQVNNKLDIIQKRMREKEKDVQNIEKQISFLGKNMGWPEQDHNDFVSIWHRGSNNKNYFQIQDELKTYFAYYTGEQIQQHMNKYMKWRKMTEEKKQHIAQFKVLKEQRKIEELRLMNLQRDRSKEERNKIQLKKRQQKQQNQLKQKVNEWKETKMRQKRQEEQRLRRQQIDKKREEGIRRREAVQSKKQIVEQWRQQQTQKKEMQILKRVQSARKPPTNKQTEERIRKREEELIQKKKQILIDRKRQQQLQRQKDERIRDQKFVKFSHVNNKLEHKTTAMKEKQRQKFDGKDKKQANTFGGQLIMTGIRATPNWLKGI